MIFQDRAEAGKKLATALQQYKKHPNLLIIGLPRGGVVVAAEVANILQQPLDIIVPRKISAEHQPEFAVGAVAEDGEVIWNESYKTTEHLAYLTEAIERERKESARRLSAYRANRPPRHVTGKTVLLIDDGIATGLTMQAAIATARKEHPKKLIVAVPHGAPDSITKIRSLVDEMVVLREPTFYPAVGAFYETFEQTNDDEVIRLIQSSPTPSPSYTSTHHDHPKDQAHAQQLQWLNRL